MSKTFIGQAATRATYVWLDDDRGYPLEVRPLGRSGQFHSPDGHSWGYGGSGPSQLAHDLLWDVLGVEPAPSLYHAFKEVFIAPLDIDRDWTLDEIDVADWVRDFTAGAS